MKQNFGRVKGSVFELPKGSEFEPAAKTLRSEGSSPQKGEPATAVAFLLPTFLWRSKENEVSAKLKVGGRAAMKRKFSDSENGK